MIYLVKKWHADACGNRWFPGEEYYIEDTEEEIRKVFPEFNGFTGWKLIPINLIKVSNSPGRRYKEE